VPQQSAVIYRERLERGAGYVLLGVWGYPPVLKIPQDWGIRGLIKNISAFYHNETWELPRLRLAITTCPLPNRPPLKSAPVDIPRLSPRGVSFCDTPFSAISICLSGFVRGQSLPDLTDEVFCCCRGLIAILHDIQDSAAYDHPIGE
jgi:hypothetical protein